MSSTREEASRPQAATLTEFRSADDKVRTYIGSEPYRETRSGDRKVDWLVDIALQATWSEQDPDGVVVSLNHGQRSCEATLFLTDDDQSDELIWPEDTIGVSLEKMDIAASAALGKMLDEEYTSVWPFQVAVGSAIERTGCCYQSARLHENPPTPGTWVWLRFDMESTVGRDPSAVASETNSILPRHIARRSLLNHLREQGEDISSDAERGDIAHVIRRRSDGARCIN